jgi:glutamate mutase epsilon subunit
MKFSQFVQAAGQAGRLVVQPRMGFADMQTMRLGLDAVSRCNALAVGTITLDSYTRVGDHESARQALRNGQHLNGFPIVAHGSAATRGMLATLLGLQTGEQTHPKNSLLVLQPGSQHAPFSKNGASLLVIWERPVTPLQRDKEMSI